MSTNPERWRAMMVAAHAKDRNIVGERFGLLVVLGRIPGHPKMTRWACQCDCGNLAVVRRGSLVSGLTVACGCLMIRRKGLDPLGPKRKRASRAVNRFAASLAGLVAAPLPKTSIAPGRVHSLSFEDDR